MLKMANGAYIRTCVVPAAERRRNEVVGEGVGDVGHADQAHYGPKRATESLLQCRNREQCQHVKHHRRRHEEDEQPYPRCGADPTEPNDHAEMRQMGGGEGEAEIAAISPKEPGGGADQQGETAAGIGKPEQKEREAGGHLQGMSVPGLPAPKTARTIAASMAFAAKADPIHHKTVVAPARIAVSYAPLRWAPVQNHTAGAGQRGAAGPLRAQHGGILASAV